MKNLRNVDLNLLVILDALLDERHVTRAALRIGLTQPSVSNALNRLRAVFGDELLVRTPSGMEPTPRALQLQRPMRRVLREIEKIVEEDSDFVPATAQNLFRLRMGDLHNVFFLPPIIAEMERTAPGIQLSVSYMPPDETVNALMNDEIDLAISIGLDHPKSIRSTQLYTDRLVCVMRQGHPAASREMTLDLFLSLNHIKVAQSPADPRFIDDELARQSLIRKIPLQVQHWLVAPDIVENTDLVSTTWKRIVDHYCRDSNLVSVPLPFGPKAYKFRIYWHRRYDGSAANGWLRSIVLNSSSGNSRAPEVSETYLAGSTWSG